MSHTHIRKIETSEQRSLKLWQKHKLFKKTGVCQQLAKFSFEVKGNLRFTNTCRQDLSKTVLWHYAFSTIAIGVGKWVRQFAILTPPSPSVPYYHFPFGLRTYKSVGVFLSYFFEQSQMKGKRNSDCRRLKGRKNFSLIRLSGWDHVSASVTKMTIAWTVSR